MTEEPSKLPSDFDRQLGLLADLPDVLKTGQATIQVVPLLGVGGSSTFILQTIRQADEGDTVFLQIIGPHAGALGATRLVLPSRVTAVIARQRDALTAKARSKGAKAAVETRKAKGIVPGFLRHQRKQPSAPNSEGGLIQASSGRRRKTSRRRKAGRQ